ncbi:uncharacterized protein B0T15DRAFT_549901 [Chaetomium strumarium]|uniref:FHA domain-containing protein n=1 Tax=Chaetomium strumarium TaxID=1170767 RepID=A0AAJ0M3T1_9PEZI|nr:hypothetical protein B0T15DRAFT_549901 [Chaetomium strumarium]
MSRHVLLSLSADSPSGSNIVYPERRIILTPENAKITIGRASKKLDSCFVAALDNAWFDCAKLEIHDVGSLHGTFINGGGRIPRTETRELKDGDMLRFGAPIWRGTEQYVPTTVKVGVQFVNPDTSASGTFQVPDSDDESDIDVSTDSDESGESAEQRSPTAQSTRVLTQPNVIDLTSNHGCAGSRQVIDLSSDCGSPISIGDDNEHHATSHADPVNRNLDDLDINHSASPDGTDDLSDLGDIDMDQDTQIHDHAEDESGYGENSRGGVTDDISNATDDGLSEYTSDDDSWDFSDDQSSDSRDDPLNPPGHPPDYTGSVEHPETLALIESLSHPIPQPRIVAPVTIMGLLNSDEPEPPALPSPRLLPRPEPEKTNPEQPVSATSLQNLRPPRDLIADLSCSLPHDISAEYLGAKTGKTEFFLAREQNKLALIAAEQQQRTLMEEVQNSQRRLASVQAPRFYNPENMALPYQLGPACLEPLGPLSKGPSLPRLADVAEPYALPTSSGLGRADLDRPLSPPIIAPSITMAGDVDSFFRRTHVGISDIVETHQQSPSKKRKADDMSSSTHKQERWAIETAQTPQTENTNHTVAASREDSSKEGERAPASHCEDNLLRVMGRVSPAPTHFSDQPSIVEEPNQSFVLSKQGKENTESSVITPPLTPERPVKKPRMMMVAERLGYAALGGVTAGAMIMGTLIYTAPTFG